jgi:hypothetical protein
MPDRDSDPPRRRLEGVLGELIKRAVEIGVEKATEAPDTVKNFVSDLKLPKEIAGYLLTQVEETKTGLFRVVAKEMRDFLEHANVFGEMQRLLTTVQFEVNTTIRFRPNDKKEKGTGEGGGDEAEPMPTPEVKTDFFMKRDDPPKERGRARE